MTMWDKSNKEKIIHIGLFLSKNKSILKLSGIVFALGYLITFLGVWIYQTEIQSNTYALFGEPNLFIKYGEWLIGIIAIYSLSYSGKKELDAQRRVSYDPLV